MKNRLKTGYEKIFGQSEGLSYFYAPGRVNLIGEHIDYNGGYVLPCTLSIGNYAAVSPRSDKKVAVYSENLREQGIIEFDTEHLQYEEADDWANYPKGVYHEMKKLGVTFDKGLNIYYWGNLHSNAGLSSSASIEVLTATIINHMYDARMDKVEIAQLCQRAENQFVGVNCGIMDQFSISVGEENKCVLIDCDSLEYRMIPAEMQNYKIVITNTNKKRGLADSKYNERRSECDRALEIIKGKIAIDELCDMTIEQFEQTKHLLTDEILLKRARHAVYENHRTIKASEYLLNGQLEDFGHLMVQSHESLRDDYEVTCEELDLLFDLSKAFDGVVGTRMTGAGFGGCIVSIVEEDRVGAFIEQIGPRYLEKTNLEASFYVVEVGCGAKKI